jgi:arginase
MGTIIHIAAPMLPCYLPYSRCPVSFVTGVAKSVSAFDWVPTCLPFNRLAYIGLRDVDPGEKEILRRNNVAAYSMYHVDKYGIGKVVEMALDRINPGARRPLHLSFDVDAMDPTIAPSTGTPVRGGLSWRESMFICEAVAETGCLVAMDLMVTLKTSCTSKMH